MSPLLRTLMVSAMVLTAIVVSNVPAHAASTLLAGPGSYTVGATTAATELDLAGLTIGDRFQPFTINGSAGGVATGNIQESVLRSNSTGFLHFYYRVIFDSISGFQPGSYIEWLNLDTIATDGPLAVGRRTDGLGTATSSHYDLAGTGESRFDYNLLNLDPANAGFSTQFHFLKTDDTNFALTGQVRLTGFEFIGFNAQSISSAWLPTFAPAAAAVPETESWAMLVVGLAAVSVFKLRRSL